MQQQVINFSIDEVSVIPKLRIARLYFLKYLIVGIRFGVVDKQFGQKYNTMKDQPVILKLEAPWEEVKERLKDNDITLTDEDLEYTPGHEEELVERLERKMNKPREQVIAYIERCSYIKWRKRI